MTGNIIETEISLLTEFDKIEWDNKVIEYTTKYGNDYISTYYYKGEPVKKLVSVDNQLTAFRIYRDA